MTLFFIAFTAICSTFRPCKCWHAIYGFYRKQNSKIKRENLRLPQQIYEVTVNFSNQINSTRLWRVCAFKCTHVSILCVCVQWRSNEIIQKDNQVKSKMNKYQRRKKLANLQLTKSYEVKHSQIRRYLWLQISRLDGLSVHILWCDAMKY